MYVHTPSPWDKKGVFHRCRASLLRSERLVMPSRGEKNARMRISRSMDGSGVGEGVQVHNEKKKKN